MTITAVIQARMSSSRLPGKVMAEALGRPMLELMIARLRHALSLGQIVIATTSGEADDAIERLGGRLGVGVYRGSEHDVRGRVLGALESFGASLHVEMTGDCPLIDPAIVDRAVEVWAANSADYVATDLEETYPVGMAVAVYRPDVLADSVRQASDAVFCEHPSLHICRHPERYRQVNVAARGVERRPDLRLTLDTADDLRVLRAVFEHFGAADTFSLPDIIRFLDAHPAIARANAHVVQRRV